MDIVNRILLNFCQKIGEDEFGNKYYQNKNGKRLLFIMALLNLQNSNDLHSWLHYYNDKIPHETEKYSWQNPHSKFNWN